MKVSPGDTVLVFDPRLWGGKDKGDNSQFFKKAKILNVQGQGDRQTAAVTFEHDGRTSYGHFTRAMKKES